MLFNDLKQQGIYRGYVNHVMRLNPILERMSERGMPVDPEVFARVSKQLKDDMAMYRDKMQALVPPQVKTKKAYKKEPRNKTGCELINGVWYRWNKWSPSNQGLVRYMKHKNHTVPKAIKDGKDTTNKLELARLHRSTKDELYGTVIQYRKAQTILRNHIKNWKPGTEGRVHTTFYFDPATGQLSSRRPNVQNAPKHDDPEFGGYARTFREIVKARPQHLIMEFDYRAFHVQTLGFEARDLDLMRMGRLDIHSFVTAHFLNLPDAGRVASMSDDEAREYLKWVKKNHKYTRDAQCKHALLGYNNGMGYRKLYLQYREFFNSQTEARRVMELLDHLFPKAKVYRDNICQKAHDQGYLISRHGYIRYFWEVNRWQNGDWSHGDDHEAALCFFTQNDAHGELKDRILTIAEQGLDEKYGLLNTIHDSLIFECPIDLAQECRYNVGRIMEAPSLVLIDPISAPKGLSVEVEVQGGPDWANMLVM